MKTGKLVKLNKTIYPLVEITLLKGEKTNITWGCLSALIETNILSAYSKYLKDENLYLYENIVDNNKTIEANVLIYEKKNKLSIINSIQVLVSPWEKGFTCGIMLNENSKISSENYELFPNSKRHD